MKTKLVLAFFMVPFMSWAQFPAPSNLEFDYQYIMIDQAGYCNGQWIGGPAYCSHFNWSPPDTSATLSTLDHYNLYYNEFWNMDTVLVLYATVQDTFYTVEDGFIGEMWVTAEYSNPPGESEPSNIVFNGDLPIHVVNIEPADNSLIQFDRNLATIRIIHPETIGKINLYDSQGRLISEYNFFDKDISVGHLNPGLYIIEILDNSKILARLKIVR